MMSVSPTHGYEMSVVASVVPERGNNGRASSGLFCARLQSNL